MLKLEEILTLHAIVHAKATHAKIEQLEDLRQNRKTDGYFYCLEQEILESSIQWMYDAKKLYEDSKLKDKEKYAGLSLAEFIAQSRPL